MESLPGIIEKLLRGQLQGDARHMAELTVVSSINSNLREHVPVRAAPAPASASAMREIFGKIKSGKQLAGQEAELMAQWRKWKTELGDVEQENIRRLRALLYAHRVHVQAAESTGAPDIAALRDKLRQCISRYWGIQQPPVGAIPEREVAERIGRLATKGSVA